MQGEVPSTARNFADQNYDPYIPHTAFEVARLRLAVGAVALEFAARQGGDEVTSRRFARKITRADISALLGYKRVLSVSLYDPFELFVDPLSTTDQTEVGKPIFTDIGDGELGIEEAKTIRRKKAWRVPQIVEAPETDMEPSVLVDFYFPGTNDQKFTAIAQLAKDLEQDLPLAPRIVPNNLSRAAALLVQARTFLNDFKGYLLADQTINTAANALGAYMVKTAPYVEKIVSKYSKPEHSMSVSDLVAEGQIGLLKGLEKYDLQTDSKNNVLIWCFNYIRGQAFDELRDSGYMIRQSRSDIEQAKALAAHSSGRIKLNDKELKSANEAIARLDQRDVDYLDEPLGPDTDYTRLDLVADTYGVDDEAGDFDLPDLDLESMISALSERNQKVIRMRFGFPPYNDKDGYTNSEIAQRLGLTKSRISQLLNHIILPRLEGLAKRQSAEPVPMAPSTQAQPELGPSKKENLSSRELEVLKHVLDGLNNLEIAKGLFVEEETVKSHLRHILAKLSAKNRTHAVRQAFELGVFLPSGGTASKKVSLPARSKEILGLVSYGLTNSEIAETLSLSKYTVNTYVRIVLEELHARNRTHAARIGFELNILE